MEAVTINIKRANLIADMKVTSHSEATALADPQERYLAELGSDKLELAHQCITDAATEAGSVLRRFLTGFYGDETATDNYDTADIVYVLSVTARKAPGLADALAKAVHAYVVDSALDKYYVSVSRPDMAQRHRDRLASHLTVIDGLLHRRTSPTYTT